MEEYRRLRDALHRAGPTADAENFSRLMQVVSADGMLPETYDPNSGDWLARHWFAWPGSLVGLLHATIDGRGPWVAPRAPRG